MKILVRYINSTKKLGLSLKPIFGENLSGKYFFVFANWSGYKDTRRSVSGWLLYINNFVIGWVSHGQKMVESSSCTSEYVEIFEIVKEVMYIRNMTMFMGLKVELTIVIHCDNVGALYLDKNSESK